MRSTRAMTSRSPTSSSISASAASQAGEAAAAPHVVGVGRQRRHERAGRERQHVAAAGRRSRRPSAGCGSRRPGGRPGPTAARRRCGRAAPAARSGVANGRVAEVDRGEVGAALGQAETQQAQVVVLHQHGGALGGDLGHRVGERLVHVAVGLPRLAQVGPERRLAGQVVEAVVDEPQDLVADHVVGQPVGLGVDAEQADAEVLRVDHAGGRRLAVAVGHGGGHPQRVGARDQGPEARHEPAGAPPGHQPAAVVRPERQRATVRHDDDGAVHETVHASAAAARPLEGGWREAGGRAPALTDRASSRSPPTRCAAPPPPARWRRRRARAAAPAGWEHDEVPGGRRGRGHARRAGRPQPHHDGHRPAGRAGRRPSGA